MNRRGFIKGAAVGSGLLSAGMVAGVNKAFAAASTESKKNNTQKKSLIVYASRTSNTAKVAERFKSTLEKNGWQCDMYRVQQNSDPMSFPYNFKDYDLICAGSGIRMHSPYIELLNVLRIPIYGFDPRIMLKQTEGIQLTDAETKKMQEVMKSGGGRRHAKIVLGADAKKALSFATYAGYEFGAEEAQPALDWINLELAHLEVKIVGKFCCQGSMIMSNPLPGQTGGDSGNRANEMAQVNAGSRSNQPGASNMNQGSRPNERDLLRAELFIEKILEDI